MTLTPSPELSPDGASPASPSIVAAAAFGGSTKWWGYGLSIVGGAFGLFVALWRDGAHPVWQGALAAILMLTIPLIVLAMVLASPASFESGGGARRGVNGLIALPFVALLFSNLYHAQIDPWQPALPAALAAVVVLPLAWNIRNAPGLTSPLGMLTVVTVCAAVYGYGATSVIDIQLDFSAGAVTPVQILDKHEPTAAARTAITSPYLPGDRAPVRTRSRSPARPTGRLTSATPSASPSTPAPSASPGSPAASVRNLRARRGH